jgi:eukaryotic-like serine/threonine-protein kinase
VEPGARLGPYEVVAAVGAGGMGEVYRARDTRLGRDVAVKVLPPEYAANPKRLRRFEQEARAVAALNHPNILAVFDVGSTAASSPGNETVHYLVTELLEGESLFQRLASGPLPIAKAVDVAVQMARGLAAAHEKGIIHRDLKPGNVFVTNDGHVKLLDFGLAKFAPPGVSDEVAGPTPLVDVTEAGAVLGTVAYMSPEQVRGRPVDPRSDIFSFGCVLYEMLAGGRAFQRESAADTFSAILHEEPGQLPPGVPPALRRIVSRCLEKQPGERFASAHDVAIALQALEGLDPSAAVHWRLLPPHSWLLPAGVAAGVLALAAAGWWVAARGVTGRLPSFHPRRVPGQLGSVADVTLSPDGTAVAYASVDGEASEIWIVDVRGGKPIRLTERGVRSAAPAWFPDGSAVAFSSDDGRSISVWRVPRFGGTPWLMVPDAREPAISPDGSRVAFARPRVDGALRIFVAPIAAPDKARPLTGDDAGLWDQRRPAWSPDGRWICYEDSRDIWLVASEGGAARRLTHADGSDQHAAWSPDGRYVYFTSSRNGTHAVWRQRMNGDQAERVTQGTTFEEDPTVSRDGRYVAFLSGIETWTVALVDLRRGKVYRLGHTGRTAYPAFAPGSGAIVCASDLGGSWDLWSFPLHDGAPGGEPTRLTDHPGECVAPTFSPDGRWIAYFRAVAGQRDVYIVSSAGGLATNFTAHPGVNIDPAWSPDGRELAFVSNRAGWHQLWTAPVVDGRRVGEPRQITREVGDTFRPCWSPDGKELAYVLATEADRDVRIVAADGRGASRSVTSGAKAVMARWLWATNTLLVSGYWGQKPPSLRLVPPAGGAGVELALPAQLQPDEEAPLFEANGDGSLLALLQRTKEKEIWVLEADEGRF